jgi:hypothetical protein
LFLGEEWAVIINNPPNKPTISGPTSGQPDVEYTFSAETTDPESEDIKYWFDWDDGSNSGWLPYDQWKASGDSISTTHKWSQRGNYDVKVKAMDKSGDISAWSDPRPISLTKKRTINTPFILRFLQNHSNILPIIQK